MKAMKAALLLLVVLGVIAAAAASMWLGQGVKLAVESYGPGILGAPVTVGAVMLAPWSGKGVIKNLVIGNPPGYKGAHAVRVGSVEVNIRLRSLMSETIVVESVDVREPEILYEMGSGGSNLSRLQANATAAVGKPASAKPGSKSMLIKELLVSDGQVGVSASALGQTGVTIPLPAVKLSNLGGKGRTPAQAVSQVLGAVSGSAGRAVSGIGTKALSDAASTAMSRLGGLFKEKK